MPQRPREIARPTELSAASALLGRTDLSAGPVVVSLRPVALTETEYDILVDLSRLGLDAITADEREICLGAQTPVQTLVESTVIRSHAHGLLALAARLAAPLTLRHAATLGAAWQAEAPRSRPLRSALGTSRSLGELAAPSPTRSPVALLRGQAAQGDKGAGGPPEIKLALLVLDVAPQYAAAAPGELLTQLCLPVLPPRGLGVALERVARAARDEAIVAVAVKLYAEAGVARGVRVALAGASPRPQRFPGAEAALEGQAVTAERLTQLQAAVMAEAAPGADFRGSAEYRRAMAGVLAARAVAQAWKQATA